MYFNRALHPIKEWITFAYTLKYGMSYWVMQKRHAHEKCQKAQEGADEAEID